MTVFSVEVVKTRSHGFTLVEMLMVVAIIVMLAALLMPSLQQALESSRQVACANQLHQIAVWAMQYTDENNGALPLSDKNGQWWRKSGLIPTNKKIYSGTIFHCPQYVASVEPKGSLYVQMNCSYGLSYMLSGGYIYGAYHNNTWPFPPRNPRTKDLNSRGYWLADGGVCSFWSNDGYGPNDNATISPFWTWTNSGNTPWTWNLDASLPYFQPHPAGMANFIYGDLHTDTLNYEQYNAMDSVDKKWFDAQYRR